MSVYPDLEPLLSTPSSSTRQPPAGSNAHSRARALRNLETNDVSERHKRIVICADGTWNTPQQTAGGGPAPTNVPLLWQSVKEWSATKVPQLAYYHPGVGTGGVLDRIAGGINGVGCGGTFSSATGSSSSNTGPATTSTCSGSAAAHTPSEAWPA